MLEKGTKKKGKMKLVGIKSQIRITLRMIVTVFSEWQLFLEINSNQLSSLWFRQITRLLYTAQTIKQF